MHTFTSQLITRLLLLSVFIISSLTVSSQRIRIEEGIYHWEGAVSAGLNNDGFQVDFSIACFPIEYLGLKMSLGTAAEIEEMGDWGAEDWEKSTDYTARFKFTPAAVLRTPRLIYWRQQEMGFHLFGEAGIILSPGAHGSKRARIASHDFRAGINVQTDFWIWTIGYGITNFSLYSGRPISHHSQPHNDNYLTHSVFVAVAYKF